MMEDNRNWTDEIEGILEKMRKNSVSLSNRHRKNFYEYRSYSKYFDIPIIIFSTLQSVFTSSGGVFLNQELVNLSSSGVSMLIVIISSIKLYLNLEQNIKTELEMSKSFHTLALELFKVLELSKAQRNFDGLEYCNKKYADYIKLVEQSNLLRKNLKVDYLLEIKSNINDDLSLSSGEENHKKFRRLESDFSKEEEEL